MYVVTHKAFIPPYQEGYLPIQVGKSFTGNNLGFIADDTGDNITEKNQTYCELTALYWIWKNDKESDIVGLCHYRRYFSEYMFGNSYKCLLKKSTIQRDLNSYDVIMPKLVYLKSTVEEKYSQTQKGFQKDLDATRQIIEEKYPEYIPAYDKVMHGHEQYFWNMFVIKKSQLDEYCEWVFDILRILEEQLDLTNYNTMQRRIYGFISERLLNVWIAYKKLRVKEHYVFQTELSKLNNAKANIGIAIKKKRV